MGTLRVMSRRGDDTVVWDRVKAATDDPEAAAAVREAQRIFRDQQRQGGTAFRVAAGRRPIRIETFDIDAEEIVMIPRVVGG